MKALLKLLFKVLAALMAFNFLLVMLVGAWAYFTGIMSEENVSDMIKVVRRDYEPVSPEDYELLQDQKKLGESYRKELTLLLEARRRMKAAAGSDDLSEMDLSEKLRRLRSEIEAKVAEYDERIAALKAEREALEQARKKDVREVNSPHFMAQVKTYEGMSAEVAARNIYELKREDGTADEELMAKYLSQMKDRQRSKVVEAMIEFETQQVAAGTMTDADRKAPGVITLMKDYKSLKEE